jgi:hypothetical protein
MFELRKRGRANATSLKDLSIDGKVDGALIRTLAQGNYEPFVLVTWDNKMLEVHAAEIAYHKPTIAVVDEKPFRRGDLAEERYVRDVVHRWLHRIEVLPATSARYFSPTGSRPG